MRYLSKPCFECGVIKPLDDYYTHPKTADHRLHVCKVCHRKRMRRNRKESERARKYDVARSKTEQRRAHSVKNVAKWRASNPLAARAHTMVKERKASKETMCMWCNKKRARAPYGLFEAA